MAQALALLALVAALVGAFGPANQVRTTYSWPPQTVPADAPTRSWYTPLLLARHEPESISAEVPCNLPRSLPAAPRGHVLSTARYPERAGGLAIAQNGGRLVVSVGDTVLDRVTLPSADAGGLADCAHRVTLADGRWSISGDGVERQGVVDAMPVVYGLFSGLDIDSSTGLSIDVTTIPHASRVTTRQTLAWIVAAFAGVGALLLVGVERRPRRPSKVARSLIGRAGARAHPADLVVALALLGWCVLAPVNFDDGWVIQREQMFDTSNGFSAYYSVLAANLPLDYWLEWAHHWLAEASNALIVYRLLVLVILGAVWVLCRWIAAQVEASVREIPISTWALAFAFLAGSLAWGMTMRPEPVTALFVTGVTACVVRFLTRGNAAPVALAGALAALALTAHPAGVVSLAAVIVASPKLFSWARSRLAEAVTIFSASFGLLATLAFVGADLDQRLADADTTQELSVPGRDEIERYAFLWEEPFGTPLRRGFVALLLLAVVGFLLLRPRGRRGLLDFPASVLAVGLLLLFATPSKWPSHFGALIGIGAVAIAAEAARLRSNEPRATGWQALPLLAVGAATLASVWAWWEREAWNPLDLRTLDWEPTFVTRSGLLQLAVLFPAVLLAGALLIARLRRGRADQYRVPWRVSSWIPAAIAVPAIAFTAGVLVLDAAKTTSWTLTRQNLESITGGAGCGLAEDVVVSQPSSSRPLGAGGDEGPPLPAWVPPAPTDGVARFALGPASGVRATPWFELPANGRTGLFFAGTPSEADSLWLRWGTARNGGTEELGGDEITEVVGEGSGNSPWRLFASGDFPPRPAGANMARVEYRPGTPLGSALAVTSPVTYDNERLVALMSGPAARTLVYPELYLYFPCRRMPALRSGAVEVPQYLVIGETESPPLRYHVTSPFVGLLDLYEIERLPVADSEESVDRLRVFGIDDDIPGAATLPPTATTVAA